MSGRSSPTRDPPVSAPGLQGEAMQSLRLVALLFLGKAASGLSRCAMSFVRPLLFFSVIGRKGLAPCRALFNGVRDNDDSQ